MGFVQSTLSRAQTMNEVRRILVFRTLDKQPFNLNYFVSKEDQPLAMLEYTSLVLIMEAFTLESVHNMPLNLLGWW